jgi:ribonuclease BN (tRNA processing enzyme)
MPSIIFLGTAGDEYLVGKQLRGSGGIIVQVEGYQFHIDPGPGALVRAQQTGVNLRENTAVLVSHAHVNHCSDVNAVLAAMSRNGFDVNGVLISNQTFINGDEAARILPVLTNFHKNCVERVIAAKPGQRIGIENVEIQTLKAFHSDPSAMGYKLITPKFTLAYTGDTRYSKELIEGYKKSDIIILNLVNPKGENKKDSDNLGFDGAVKILEKVQPRLAVITHFGKKMLDADPINEARELQKATGVQVLAAIDGMSVNPVSYSADAKQRTLGSYGSSMEEGGGEPPEDSQEKEIVEENSDGQSSFGEESGGEGQGNSKEEE